MSILSDDAILEAIGDKEILIDPFDMECLGPNSYDVHLGDTIATFSQVIDAARPYAGICHEIKREGFLLKPNTLYLASTVEYTETHGYVPDIDATSSAARLGISVHCSAGRGEAGFCGHWTMQLSCIQPVIVYAGMPIAQIRYTTLHGEVRQTYKERASSSYVVERNSMPQASRMWKKIAKMRGESK